MATLVDYFVTFHSGPLGCALESINGQPVITRFVATPSGEAGQAATLGVTLGSVVAEVVSSPHSRTFKDTVRSLKEASRPMRVRLRRLAQVLLPVPPPLPLPLWRGNGSVYMQQGADATQSKLLSSGMLSLYLNRDPALGFRVVLQSGAPSSPVLEILAERRLDACTVDATAVITQPSHALVHAALAPSSGSGSRRSASAASGLQWKAASSVLALPSAHASLLGLVAASNTNAGTLGVIAGHMSYDESSVPPVALCLPDTAPCRSHVTVRIRLPSTAATEDLLQALVTRRMPSEIALQAGGMGGPRVLLRGGLRLKKHNLLREPRWDALRFELRSNGALQWFAENSEAVGGDRKGAYFWRPKGGVSLAHSAVLTHPKEVASAARLQEDAVRSLNVFAVSIRGDSPRTLALSAPSAADQAAWVQALMRTAALMGGGSTAADGPLLHPQPQDDLQEDSLLMQVPGAVSALAAAQDALWSASQGGAGGGSSRRQQAEASPSTEIPTASSSGGDDEMGLTSAPVPAASSQQVLGSPRRSMAAGGGAISGGPSEGSRLRSDTRVSSDNGCAPAVLAAALRWGSVEDLYRLRVPAAPAEAGSSSSGGSGSGGGSSGRSWPPASRERRQAHSPVLQSIASMAGVAPTVLVSESLFTVGMLHSAVAFKASADGAAWKPTLRSSNTRLLWGAMAHMWREAPDALEHKLRCAGCLPPTLAQGLRSPPHALPISAAGGGDPENDAQAHPSNARSLAADEDAFAESWSLPQSGDGEELGRVRGALRVALSHSVFSALQAASDDAMLYMQQPKETFSLLVTASREVDAWLGTGGAAAGAGSATGGGDDKQWYPLSERQKAYDCKNGVLRRHHFVTLIGCFLELLADPFSGGAVFDALVEDTLPLSMQVRQPGRGGGGAVQITERVMTYDTFEAYVTHLAGAVLHPPAVWDTLRASLRLDPRELLIRLEEGVHCVVTARAQSPVQQAPPLPEPRVMLPALLGMPSADVALRCIEGFSALLPEGRSKAWGAMHAVPHTHASLLPPKRVMLRVLQLLPVHVGRARDALRAWMRLNMGQDMRRLWPQALGTLRNGARTATKADERPHRALVVPCPEQTEGAAVEAKLEEGGVSTPPTGASDVQIPLLGAIKRAPLGLSFIEWRRQRRRIARAYQIARKVSLQKAAAATGGRRQLKASRTDKTATSDLQREISNLFSTQQLSKGGGGAKGDSDGDSDEGGDFTALTRKQRALLQLVPPVGQGDSGDYTTVSSDTDDSFGCSSDEEADLRWLQSSLVPGLDTAGATGGARSSVDEELLEQLHSPLGRRMVQKGCASVRVSGKLLVTDRSAYLVCGPNEVLALPLGSLGHMEYCTTAGSAVGNTVDNGLHLHECDLRRVARDEGMDSDGEASPLKALFTLAQVMARPSPTQLRTLHVFRWQLAVEQHLHAYYADPYYAEPAEGPTEGFLPFASATDEVFGRELGVPRAATAAQHGSTEVQLHMPPAQLQSEHAPTSPFVSKHGDGRAHSAAGGSLRRRASPGVMRLSGNRSVISLRSPASDSTAADTAVRADAAAAASIGVLRAVWDCLQGFQYSAEYNGAFGQPHMLLPGSISPSCTLVFSRLKDFVLGQGEERVGGRRRVLREALEEMAAAHALAPAVGIHAKQVWGDIVREVGWGVQELRRGRTGRLRGVGTWLKRRLVKPVRDDAAAAQRLAASCALNLVRTRALLKCTGRCSHSLLYASSILRRLRGGRSGLPDALRPAASHGPQDDEEQGGGLVIQPAHLHDLGEDALFPVGAPVAVPPATVGAQKRTAPGQHAATSAAAVLSAEYAAQSLPADVVAEQALLFLVQHPEPQWLLRSVRFVTRFEELQVVRDAQLAVFDRAVLMQQWRVLTNTVVKPYQTARALVRYTLKWENPFLSATVLLALLLLAWWDVLLYLPAMVLSFGALGVLVWGGLKPAQRRWLQAALSEPPKRSANLNWVQRWRHTSKVFGKVQFKLHKQLLRWQRLLAVLSWRSPTRTRLFLAGALLLAVVLCVVPFRLLFVLFVLGQFSKPLRDNASGLYQLALQRFLQGLPLPSLSAAVYAATPAGALSNVPQGSVVQTLSSLQGVELEALELATPGGT